MLKQATRFGAETVMTREDQNLQRVSSGYREAWPVLSFINILRFSSTKGRNNQKHPLMVRRTIRTCPSFRSAFSCSVVLPSWHSV